MAAGHAVVAFSTMPAPGVDITEQQWTISGQKVDNPLAMRHRADVHVVTPTSSDCRSTRWTESNQLEHYPVTLMARGPRRRTIH